MEIRGWKERREISVGGLGIFHFNYPSSKQAALCPTKVASKLHQLIIRDVTKRGVTRNGTVEQKLELPKWPLEILPVCASYALISSLTVCMCVCMRERGRERKSERRVKCLCLWFLWEYMAEVSACLTGGQSHTAVLSSVITYPASTMSLPSADYITHKLSVNKQKHTHTHSIPSMARFKF